MAITRNSVIGQLEALRPLMGDGRTLLAMLEQALRFFDEDHRDLPFELTSQQKQDIEDFYLALKAQFKTKASNY